jgi:hypothetical protein
MEPISERQLRDRLKKSAISMDRSVNRKKMSDFMKKPEHRKIYPDAPTSGL